MKLLKLKRQLSLVFWCFFIIVSTVHLKCRCNVDDALDIIVTRCQTECADSLPSTQTGYVHCNDTCRLNQCASGCQLWQQAADSNCEEVCNGTSERQVTPIKHLHCNVGCRLAADLYIQSVLDALRSTEPPAPVLVADTQTNVSVSVRWKGPSIPLPMNVSYLIQWKYDVLPGGWEYYKPKDPIIGTNVQRIDGLHPYTKYKFRVAWIVLSKYDLIMSKESVCISTLAYGAPSTAPIITSVATVDANHTSVTWDPPQFPNGPILSYVVHLYRQPSGFTLIKDIPEPNADHFFMFNNLQGNTTYSIAVSCRNSVGEGPKAVRNFTTPLGHPDAESGQAYLVISTHRKVIRQGMDVQDEPEVLYQSNKPHVNITGMAIHVRQNVAFVSDSLGEIHRVPIDGIISKLQIKTDMDIVDVKRPTLRSSVSKKQHPGLLSVDWLSDKLYILDRTPPTITRCDLDGGHYEVLVTNIKGSPTDLKVDPYNGFLYWIVRNPTRPKDNGLYRLDLASFDKESGGRTMTDDQAELIVHGDGSLTTLAIDHRNFRIILPNNTANTVYSTSLSGSELMDVRRNTQQPKFQGTLSMVVYNDSFYWTTGQVIYGEERLQDRYYHNSIVVVEAFVLDIVQPEAQPIPVPVNPVEKVQALFHETMAQVTWLPPKPLGGMGIGAWQSWTYEVVVYKLYNEEDTVTMFNINETSCTIEGLDRGTEYGVRVKGCSQGGKGPWSEPFIGKTLKSASNNGFPYIVWSSIGLLKSDIVGNNVESLIHQSALHNSQVVDISWYRDLLFLATNGSQVYMYNTTTARQESHLYGPLPVPNVTSAVSIAVDWLARKIYWSNPKQQVISRANFDGSSVEPLLILTVAKELNIDAVHGRIYWTTSHSVECARLNGEEPRKYYQTGFFSGKRVMGLTLDHDRQRVLWMVWNLDGAKLYNAKMGSYYPVAKEELTMSIVTKSLGEFPEDARQGPIRYFDDRLLWIRDPNEAIVSDLSGGNIAHLSGSHGLENLRSLIVIDPTLQPSPDGMENLIVQVVPNAVDTNTIRVNGVWNDFNISWSKVKNVNHGRVLYEIGIDDGLDREGSKIVTVSEYPSYVYPQYNHLPPYSSMTISIRAFTYWSSSNRSVSIIKSPMSVSSEPLHPRVFVMFHVDPMIIRAEFRWSPPKHPNGIILGYIVTVWNGGRDPIWEDNVVNPNKLIYITKQLAPNSNYIFRIRAYSEVGESAQSKPVEIRSNEWNPVPKLMSVNGNAIEIIDIDNGDDQSIKSSSIVHPTDVNYLWQDGTIFWLDRSLDSIMRSTLNGTNITKMHNMLNKGNSLTVDWIGRRIYWSEIEQINGNSSIWTMSIDRNDPKKLLSIGTRIGSIRVEPFTSTLLWTSIEWNGAPTLLKSTIDANDIRPFFPIHVPKNNKITRRQIEDNMNCNCSRDVSIRIMTIDHPSTKVNHKFVRANILFVDSSQHAIWTSDINGCKCQLLLNMSDHHQNDYGFPPTSLSSDHANLYWSNSNLGKIFAISKSSNNLDDVMTIPSNNSTYISNGFLRIIALGPFLQPYPDVTCLRVPRSYNKAPIVTNYTDTTITIKLEPLASLPECANISRPSIMYTVHYHVTNDTSPAKHEGCNENSRNSNECFVLNTYATNNIISGLRPYIVYAFQVAISNFYDNRTIGFGPTIKQRTLEGVPSKPTNVKIIVVSPEDIQINWNPPTNIYGPSVRYSVYLRQQETVNRSGSVTLSANDREVGNMDTPTLGHLVSGLQPGRRYVTWVRAHTKFGTGFNDSDKITVKMYETPNDLQLENITSGSITLKWTSPNDPTVIKHTIQYNDEDSLEFENTLTNRNYTFHIGDLKPKSRYTFRLRLVYQSYTDVVYQWPKDQRFTFETLGDSPSPPGRPEVLSIQRDEYKVLWTPSDPRGGDQLEYTLEMQLLQSKDEHADHSTTEWSIVYNGTETQWTIISIEPVPDQYPVFRVRAKNEYGISNYSEYSLRFTYTQASGHMRQMAVVLGASVPILCLLLLGFAYIMFKSYRRKEKDKKILQEMVLNMQNPNLELATLRDLPQNHNFVHENNALYALSALTDADLAGLPHVSSNQIVLIKFLGCGAFGEVFEGIAHTLPGEIETDIRVAVKTLRKGATDHEKAEFLKEAQLMSNFKHDHILSLLGVCLDNDPNFLILELMDGGDLLTYLRNNRPTSYVRSSLNIHDLISICVDVAKGCTHLEDMHFIHRDLAARNCLVSSHDCDRRIVKIGDFGLARDIYKNDYYRKEGEGLLPVRWMSPESLIDGVFTSQSDVWAFGVLLWEVMTLGQQPYPARTNVEVLHYVRGGGRLDKPDNCPDDLHQLMLKCWSYSAAERPTFKYCLQQLQELKRKSEHQLPMITNNNSVHNQNYIGRDRANGVDNLAYTCDERLIESMATSTAGLMANRPGSSTERLGRGPRFSEADTISLDDTNDVRLEIGRLTSESDTDDLTKLLDRQHLPTGSHRYLELLYDDEDIDNPDNKTITYESDEGAYEIPLSTSVAHKKQLQLTNLNCPQTRTLSDGLLQGSSTDGDSVPSLFTGEHIDTDDAKQMLRLRGVSQPLLSFNKDTNLLQCDKVQLHRSRSSLGHIPWNLKDTLKDSNHTFSPLRATAGDMQVSSAPLLDTNINGRRFLLTPWRRHASSISLGTGTGSNSSNSGSTDTTNSDGVNNNIINNREGSIMRQHLSVASGLSVLSCLDSSSSSSTSGIDMDYAPSSTWC